MTPLFLTYAAMASGFVLKFLCQRMPPCGEESRNLFVFSVCVIYLALLPGNIWLGRGLEFVVFLQKLHFGKNKIWHFRNVS